MSPVKAVNVLNFLGTCAVIGVSCGAACVLPLLAVNWYMENGFHPADVEAAARLFVSFSSIGFCLSAGLALIRPLYSKRLQGDSADDSR